MHERKRRWHTCTQIDFYLWGWPFFAGNEQRVFFLFFFCHRWKTPALLLLKSSTCFCVLLLFSNTGESCERCDVEVYMCALRCCFLSIFFFFFLLNIRFWHGFPYMYIKKCYPFLNCFFFFFFLVTLPVTWWSMGRRQRTDTQQGTCLTNFDLTVFFFIDVY